MISLCVIFRDHRATLERCLHSAALAVDELLAVDTGSADGSDAIARACGARVELFPWSDDIALARNAALERARGDWILFLDADDELMAAEELRPLVQDPGVHGWILHLEHVHEREPMYGEALRLYRAGLRYEGVIHEQLLVPPDWVLKRAPGVYIRHTGFTEAAIASEDKARRNLRLGLLELQRAPRDSHAHLRAAKCFMSAGRPGEGLEHCLKAIELSQERDRAEAEAYVIGVEAAQKTADHGLALRLGTQGLGRYPTYVDLHCLVAWSYLRLGRVAEARHHLLKAVALFDHLGDYPVTGGVTLPKILDLLGRLPP